MNRTGKKPNPTWSVNKLKTPKNLNLNVPILLSTICVSLLFGVIIGYCITSVYTPTISGGIFPGAPSYTIWAEGSNYFAKSATGSIDFSGTNATTIINNALSTAGKVFLKSGTYEISGSQDIGGGIIPPDQSCLEGEIFMGGYGTTTYGVILKLADNAQCSVISRAKNSGHNSITIKNLLIDGNKANNPDNMIDGSECGVYLGATQGFLIENVKVINTRRDGLYIASSSYGKIQNVLVQGAGRAGIELDAAVYNDVINVSIMNCTGDYPAIGGLDISTDTDMKFAVNIIGGRFFWNYYGISIRNYGVGTYTEVITLSDVETFENFADGIYVVQGRAISIENSISYFNNRSGILLNTGSSNISISTSHFYDNDYYNLESDYGNGIDLQNSNNTFISVCFSGNLYGSSQNYGYREQGTSDYNTIIGCSFKANTVAYQILGSHCHIDLTWAGNTWMP